MSSEIEFWAAVLLGVLEGLTEFLPVSSTGHLTLMEQALGYDIEANDVTAFTAIIQVGAIAATFVYFRHDLWQMITAIGSGIAHRERRAHRDFRFAIAIAIGSLPIGIAGLTFQDQIEGELRSLWVIGAALILWSGVMWFADRAPTQARHEEDVRMRDTIIIGVVQCMALVPGVSRSGATISAGLLLGLDRVEVTRLSFFLAIPALTAAGLLQTVTEFDNISNGVGWGPTLTATAISFIVAYASIAWLLRFVAGHTFNLFVIYRVVLGIVVLALVGAGVVSAT